IAKGSGWQHIGAYVNLGASYLFGIPAAVVLGFPLHLRAKGFWIRIVIGSVILLIGLLVLIGRTDWGKQTNVDKDQVKAAIKAQQDQQIDNALLVEARFCSDVELTKKEIERMVMEASRAEYIANDKFKHQLGRRESSTSEAEPSSSGGSAPILLSSSSDGNLTTTEDLILVSNLQLWLSSLKRTNLPSGIKADIVVAKDGSGKYKKISNAIKAVPEKSKKRFMIYVKKGI
ncbi:OTU domain-containing protein 5-B-like protein isoform X1, partial [Tanacetum coccineum]